MTTSTPHIIDRKEHAPAGVWDALLARLDDLAGRIGDRVHANVDTRAQADGWQVTRTRFGGRTYRHPGFTAGQANP